ncbi:capsular biosynthesis protein [Campylobacter sp. MIT 97-5078]|uniref:capsular biosynthesis protein n=1 Tax=Campylobacter sp. MIT 97-5078 TaxID=1548153 RepID=UPI00051412CE|nr:capsular biosynthesis protein [Campylobacter sp. MIT 97-5078]KGI55217.1 capsular biosynthesis protein [Campylobacter sp. MIT 97-5078]TQR27928.1 capsular biosynthesis protein [Campylobacter sp. MIT 97-5078]
MKKLVIDLDGTLTIDDPNVDYINKKPNLKLISILHNYKKMGFSISIFTSRNMRTYENDIQKITAYTLPIITSWLDKHNVPYDEIVVGKVWCGFEGFYVDDKAIRPSEFTNLSFGEIKALLAKENPYKNEKQ